MNLATACKERVWLAEGGMGSRLFSKGVAPGECLEALNLSRPALIHEVHEEYREAGAEIFKANTFGANTARLEQHGVQAGCRDMNLAAIEIARAVAGNDALVAGVIGPLGVDEPSDSKALYATQVEALAEAGADFLMLETFRSLAQLVSAIDAVHGLCHLPVVAQISPDADGNLAGGIPPEKYVPRLEDQELDAIGCNCGAGLKSLVETMRRISVLTDLPLIAQPSAGLPLVRQGQTVYPCLPGEFAGAVTDLQDAGVRILGGCCGTTPEHIRAVRSRIDANAVRHWGSQPEHP